MFGQPSGFVSGQVHAGVEVAEVVVVGTVDVQVHNLAVSRRLAVGVCPPTSASGYDFSTDRSTLCSSAPPQQAGSAACRALHHSVQFGCFPSPVVSRSAEGVKAVQLV